MADTPAAPGQVLEEQEESQPSRSNTFVDNRVAEQQSASHPNEPLGEQDEVPFPSTSQDEDTVPFPSTSAETPSAASGDTLNDALHDYEKKTYKTTDPKAYGIPFRDEEHQYEPPSTSNLPDLQRLMDSLNTGGDLDGKKAPPSLFSRPENMTSYKNISKLKVEVEDVPVDDYVEKFDTGVRDEILMIGNISLEEVQEEELRLRDEHIAYQEQEARLQRDKAQELIVKEEEAKKRVALELKEKRRHMNRNEQIQQQRERLMMDRLNRAFRRSENQLISVLEKRKAEVKQFYGDLSMSDGHYGGSKGRRWKVDWDKTPQPIQIKLKCLRGVKDKLPGGRYVLMVSLYNRLGGHVLRWSKLKGQQWGGATLPIIHDGHFYNVEMKIDQSVFTVLPSKPGIKPGMILVFELFLLRGETVPTDRVVSWGCFPITDGNFDIVEGKFKCPFLRGEMDSLINKHEKVEELMASDLDHWMCNAYFEIVKLPRYLAGQKEYEVELQFTSGMLAYPDRVNTGGEEYKDGEAPVPGSLESLKPSPNSSQLESSDLSMDIMPSNSSVDHSDPPIKKRPLPFDATEEERRFNNGKGLDMDPHTDLRKRPVSRPMTAVGSNKIHKDKKVTAGGDDDSDGTDYDDEEMFFIKKDDDFYPVKGQNGLYYKRHQHHPVDTYQRKLFTLMPKTNLLTQRRKRKKLTHLEQLEEHKFSVKKINNDKGHLPRIGTEKMQYVQRQLLAELGLSQWRSREFWGMLIMFILVFFVRIYIHYIGQWIFLQALELPINSFTFLPYTVNLNYQNTLLRTREEICVVLLGPFSNILVFIILVCVTWGSQRILGNFPDIGSKFIVAYGIQAFLDPFLILLVDCIIGRYENLGGDVAIADAAKLYWHFFRAEGSGLGGIFITVFLYFFTCFAAGAILYMYFLRLHNNGRMLDIYWRLHGEEDIFFMPYDLEVSNQELAYINKKSEQWRGEEGERKKVSVYDYIWEEENLEETVWDENYQEKKVIKEGKKEITTHVSVHTIHLDGLRELYRHFLKLPDGGIVEVFGDMAVAGMDRDVKSALTETSKKLEDMGSVVSFNNRVSTGYTTTTLESGDYKKTEL